MASIKLNNVSLDYVLKTGSISFKKTVLHLGHALLRTQKTTRAALQHSTYRALSDISLDIAVGDRIGLLGRNGAGKSTLLRVIAQIFTPDTGQIDVNGRVSGLFDISLGINPEATGYENIIHLGIMRGLSTKQARGLIPDIADFTELGTFLEAPVRTYSTGMQLKLAFGVATAMAPEIILIDEIIGVGDAYFMEKASQRILNLIENSHILVLTSHSLETIRRFCNKTIVLDHGKIQFMGNTEEGIQFYEQHYCAQ